MHFHLARASTVILMWTRAHVRNLASDYLLRSLFLLELTRVDDLRLVYRDFNGIYKRYVENAKFHVVKGSEFKSLKERLIAIHHVSEKYPELAPERRTELVQAALSGNNLQRAQQIFPKPDKNNQPGSTSVLQKLTGFLSGPRGTDEELLRKNLKKITNGVSDSDFLLQLKDVDDKDLEVPIQAAVDLACGQLSSSIDTAVKKMSYAVLKMQQDECKRSLQREIETEGWKELRNIFVNFIQAINRVSAGRRTS
jgi:hypothetical protein